MKNVIVVTEKSGENKKLLVMENINKTIIAEVAIILNTINLESRHSWAINNANINVVRDLGLTGVKNTGDYVS